ncbi:Agouti-signaling protein, partial [Varanus komodoensis]
MKAKQHFWLNDIKDGTSKETADSALVKSICGQGLNYSNQCFYDKLMSVVQRKIRMKSRNLLLGLLLCCVLLMVSDSYMILEEKQDVDNSMENNNKIKFPDLQPISIVDLTKSSLKLSRKEAEIKKSMK